MPITFKNLSIRHKLQVIVMGISTAAMVLACGALGAYEIINFRRSLIAEMSVLSRIVADRTTASISFNDPAVADETLAALVAKHSVVSAHIHDIKGNLFAQYHRKDTAKEISLPNLPASSEEGWRFESGYLFMSQPILLDREKIGTVCITSDMEDMYGLIRRYLGVAFAVLSGSLLLVFYLLAKFQDAVSKPILDLAHVAKSFSENMDCSIRASKQGEDESGLLVDAFNKMLDQIIQRDTALKESMKAAESSAREARRLAEETNHANIELEKEIAEHRRTEVQLKESEEKYRNLFDFAPDGIFITDFNGKILSFNNTAMRIFGHNDRALFSQMTDTDFYQVPDDRLKLKERLNAEGLLENYAVNFKDRSGKPFVASLSARLIGYGGKLCIQSIIRDITPIKLMEAELRDYAENLEKMVDEKTAELKSANRELSAAVKSLEDTREQLSLSAHQAGMAEIAVSVLHNIGNAINSVNVRIYHHEERLNRGEIRSLEKVFGLLCSEEFVRTDPSGRWEKLLKYFDATVSSLRENYRQLKEDCVFIRKGLDHLMEIISLQQKYAGVRGAETFEDVNELLKDSAEMMMDSVRKRNIDIEFEPAPVRKVYVNRNKMIQIFINIIKNAYEAIEACSAESKGKIKLATSAEKEDETEYVRIVISDTGTGVPRENLNKVFRFNYSTKDRGTGFGLHDAANYIAARNGVIRLYSEGPGKGAQVTIRLPASKGEYCNEQQNYRD